METPAAAIEIKLPDGAKYDPVAIGEFKTLMANEKLTPAQKAQGIIDLNEKQNAANLKAHEAHIEKIQAADLDACKADKDFGGAKFEKSAADAKAAAAFWGGEEFSKLVEAAGLDKHPAFFRTFARIKAGMAEDQTGSRIPGTQPPPAKPPPMSQKQKLAARYDKKK